MFQRNGSLLHITHRTLTGNYKGAEEQTFGHCFFCLHCAQNEPPACYGWWPSDPDGGDFEGDDGRLQPDTKEYWSRADCISIDMKRAERLMTYLDQYEQEERYQVINYGGKSCLGFCVDVMSAVQEQVHVPFGSLSISGDLRLTHPAISLHNTDGSTATELMEVLLQPQNPISKDGGWSRMWYKQQHQSLD